MSYILDALKKTEEKPRVEKSIPDLYSESIKETKKKSKPFPWPFLLVGALFVNAALLVLLIKYIVLSPQEHQTTLTDNNPISSDMVDTGHPVVPEEKNIEVDKGDRYGRGEYSGPLVSIVVGGKSQSPGRGYQDRGNFSDPYYTGYDLPEEKWEIEVMNNDYSGDTLITDVPPPPWDEMELRKENKEIVQDLGKNVHSESGKDFGNEKEFSLNEKDDTTTADLGFSHQVPEKKIVESLISEQVKKANLATSLSPPTMFKSQREVRGDELPYYPELPDELLSKLPKLSISVHLYANNPSGRIVGINGKIKHQGDTIEEDLKVEEITSDGAILNYKGSRFRLNVF